MPDPVRRPYDNVRVLDLSRELGAYAGRLFADLGADVVRVEAPASDDPLGRNDRMFLHANKRSVGLDVATDAGRAVLRDLVASAAVVLVEPAPNAPELVADVLSVPGARIATVVSYFGLTGPYAGYLGSDLVAQALGGIGWLSGEPGRPPLRIAGEQSRFVTSLYAAAATAIALWDLEARGTAHVLDVSAQECIAHSLQNALQVWDLEGRVSTRGGEGTRDATEGVFACQDGFISLAAPLAVPASWKGLCDWMREEGYPGADALAEPAWADRPTRATAALRAQFKPLFEDFVATRTRDALAREALARKILMAPVSRLSDLPADPQLVFRRYFHTVHERTLGRDVLFPGAPYRLSEPLWSMARSAPRPGEDDRSVLGPKAGTDALQAAR
jgi:benzylsuccinate CoA-transferase BbsE subunit